MWKVTSITFHAMPLDLNKYYKSKVKSEKEELINWRVENEKAKFNLRHLQHPSHRRLFDSDRPIKQQHG